MVTKESLVKDFKTLGIREGDVVFIRLSYKAIGKVLGGPGTVIDSLLDCLGKEGTLIATSFPRRQLSMFHQIARKTIYKKGMKPVTGVIPLLMGERNGACFSGNPITPFVAIGARAKEITDRHNASSSPYSLIKDIAENYSAKCLRVGGNVLVGTTHLAFTNALMSVNATQKRVGEGIYYYEGGRLRWKEKNISCFCYNSYHVFFEKHIKNFAILSEGLVGEGNAMVTDMLKTYSIEMEYLNGHPERLQCSDKSCLTCRCSYSYSDMSVFSYIVYQLKNRDEHFWDRIKDAVKLLLLGRKCV